MFYFSFPHMKKLNVIPWFRLVKCEYFGFDGETFEDVVFSFGKHWSASSGSNSWWMKWLAAVWVSSLCPAGFFGMWTFSRSNKQTGPPTKKVTDVPNIRMLELTGDLIGHSGAVQVRFTSYELFCSWCHSSVLTIFCSCVRCSWTSGRTVWSRVRRITCWSCGRTESGSLTCAAWRFLKSWRRAEDSDL